MKSYFFDAHVIGEDSGGNPIYDREYHQADHANYYRGLISDGIFSVPDTEAMKVTQSGGAGGALRILHVAPGRMFIQGYQGITEGDDEFVIADLPNGRYRVIIRLDTSEDVRAFSCELIQGTTTEYPPLVRAGNIYDMCLANVTIASGIPVIEDARFDSDLCPPVSFMLKPPYYPPGALPEILWLFTIFPNAMTPEQIGQVTSNPGLIDAWRQSGLASLIWREIQRLTTPGADTWTVPDPFGDGQPFELGILAIGGGGAGGGSITGANQVENADAWATGGASGQAITRVVTVMPGQAIPYVVGVGGEATTTVQSSYPIRWTLNGSPGGTTTFSTGLTADGGEGGVGISRIRGGVGTWPGAARGAHGGQGSDAAPPAAENAAFNAPGFGRIPFDSGMVSTGAEFQHFPTSARGGSTNPAECINPFTGLKILAAGGWSLAHTVQGRHAGVGTNDGMRGGVGGTNAGTYTVQPAIAQGCGGGAVAVTAGAGTVTVTTGAGAPGAIFLYARRSSQ